MRLRHALVLVALVGCTAPGGASGNLQSVPSTVGEVVEVVGIDDAAVSDPTTDAADEVAPAGYSSVRVLVRGVGLADVAWEHDTEVSEVGPSGWASMDVPEGAAFGSFLGALQADGRLTEAVAMGVAKGADNGGGDHGGDDDGDEDHGDHGDGDHGDHGDDEEHADHDLQWHLKDIDVPHGGSFSGVTVAVLDSGVAYETWADASGTYVPAPSLGRSSIRTPWDFVNGDAHANDDHQHGTFMATLIAASEADDDEHGHDHGDDGDDDGENASLRGVAPGVTLMPVKVLDADNSGEELWLVDGIWHAVDNGADVINLSMAFGSSYVPSRALQSALLYAHDSGVVVIGAAGNDGHVGASWPAASPLVVAVAASKRVMSGPSELAEYSNRSPKIDVAAPGGDLTTDVDGDGMVDGIVSETINAGDPSTVATWMFAGTSSATAITSGTVARLLAAGASADDIPALLAGGAQPFDGGIYALAGAGKLNVESSLDLVSTPLVRGEPHSVAMFSYLVRSGLNVVPTARLTVVDALGVPVSDREVLGTLWGEGGGAFSCRTSDCGSCTVSGPPVSGTTRTGAPRGLAWAFRAEAVVDANSSVVRPGAALFPSQKLDAVTRSLKADSRTAGGLLAFSWKDSNDPALGALGAGYSVVDLAAGMAAAPMSVVYNDAAWVNAVDPIEVVLDGRGLASIPVGNIKVSVVKPAGSALVNLKLAAIDGTGASNLSLNFGAVDMFGGKGKVACAVSNDAMWIDSETLPATVTGDLLASGGWVTPEGYAGASLMGALIAAPTAPGPSGASRIGSVAIP